MYQFVNQLSYTASVIILVVVSGERYLAIVEPLRAKSLLTRRNMIVSRSFLSQWGYHRESVGFCVMGGIVMSQLILFGINVMSQIIIMR